MRKEIKRDFNHISKNLTTEEVDKLKGLYSTYHRNCMCYKWKYMRLKRKRLALETAAIFTTSIGVIAGGITLNPIILGTISGLGIIAHTVIAHHNVSNRASQCKYAYITYEKVLSLIKSHLRGVPYNEHALLTELRVVDE